MKDIDQTITDLSARIDALEAENVRLRRREQEPSTPSLSRRNALRLGGLAAGAAGAAVLLRPTAAHATTGAMQFGTDNNAGVDGTGLTSTNGTDTLHVANSGDGAALTVTSSNGDGIRVTPPPGGIGVNAVAGGGTRPLINAMMFGSTPNATCVNASQFGRGHAVSSSIVDSTSPFAAVFATTQGSGAAVVGKSTNGIGAKFEGKTAQIQLVPSSASTHPTTGQGGQLFVDSHRRLWYCITGNRWKQIV